MSRTGNGKGANRTVIRHLREPSSGKRKTVALHFAQDFAPPDFIYNFENGRIQSIVSPTYERRGRGYVRTKSRITFFTQDGKPSSQVELGRARVAAAPATDRGLLPFNVALLEAVKDAAALFRPRELEAAESDGPCGKEWSNYFAASLALAGASSALTVWSDACFKSRLAAACVKVEAAFVAWTAALNNWNDKLDALAACIEANKIGEDQTGVGPGPGGAAEDPRNNPDGPEPERRDTMLVEDFIEHARETGNYWCSDTGDYCYYYTV